MWSSVQHHHSEHRIVRLTPCSMYNMDGESSKIHLTCTQKGLRAGVNTDISPKIIASINLHSSTTWAPLHEFLMNFLRPPSEPLETAFKLSPPPSTPAHSIFNKISRFLPGRSPNPKPTEPEPEPEDERRPEAKVETEPDTTMPPQKSKSKSKSVEVMEIDRVERKEDEAEVEGAVEEGEAEVDGEEQGDEEDEDGEGEGEGDEGEYEVEAFLDHKHQHVSISS